MGWMIVLGVCLKCVWVRSEMSVGPTRGLAERGPPFFRLPLLEWGRGRRGAWVALILRPCTQPGGGGHRPQHPPACQMVVRHSMGHWCYWVSRITIYCTLLESIQSADSINLQGERCAAAGDCGDIGVAAVLRLLELNNCACNVRPLLI